MVTTEYDSAGRLAGVRNQVNGPYYAGGVPTTDPNTNPLQYAAHGAISAMKLGNGLWEHTSFNNRLQPTEIGLGTSSTDSSKLSLGYAYGGTTNNGNVLSQTITVPTIGSVAGFTTTQTYDYDQLNRLAWAKENNGTNWLQKFKYDRYGNRNFDFDSSSQGQGATTFPAASTPNSNPQISQSSNRIDNSVSGQTSVVYDKAGNLTTDIGGQSYTYDGENHLTSVGQGVGAYSYDGDGHRVKKVTTSSTTVYVYNAAGQLVAEYSTATQTGMGGTSYLTTDNLGTPRVITDSNQAIKERHDYLPFGEEVFADSFSSSDGDANTTDERTAAQGYPLIGGGGGNTKQKFTGKERDNETNLDYFNARYYSSSQGRFTSVDPENYQALHDLSDPQSWNGYSYVKNNPLRFTDPDGRGIGSFFKGIWERLGNWEYGFKTDQQVQAIEDKWRGWLREQAAANNGNLVRCTGEGQCQRLNIDSMSRSEVLSYSASLKESIENGTLQKYPQEQIDQMTGMAAPAMAAPVIDFAAKQIQKKFKHAGDFGVKGNYNAASGAKFQQSMEQHVADPATKAIQGTYRGQPVTHYVNPQTGINVMKDASGNFLSGWKLNPSQLTNVLTRGKL